VFNQPEGNCDTKNDVDCALYSAPEHTFKKTEATGSRNHGLKSRHKRHTLTEGTQMKLRPVTSTEQHTAYRHVMHKNYRMKREMKKETFDYYDYVDDNYEAHAVKPINRDMSPANGKINQSKNNMADYEDYIYDSTPVSAEQRAKEDPYLFKSQKNEKDGQKHLVSAVKYQRNEGTEPSESFVAHTTENTLLLRKESVAAVEETTSAPIPYRLVLQNKSERMTADKLDYVYDYEYVDEYTTTSAPPELKQTDAAIDDRNIKNNTKSITSVPRYDVENSYNYSAGGTKDNIKNDVKFATLTHRLVDGVTLPASTTENILDMNKSGKIVTNQNLEAKVLEKIDSASVNLPLDDYEYEYYYDEDYTDLNETETGSKNKHLPLGKTEDQPLTEDNGHNVTTESGDKRGYSAHYAVTEKIKPQIHRPSVKMDHVSDTHETINFNLTLKAPEKLNIEPPAIFQVSGKTHLNTGIDVAALNENKSTSTHAAIISELLETNTNPSPLQEIDRRTKITAAAVQSHENSDDSHHSDDSDDYYGGDGITLASVTTLLHKHSVGVETTISGLAFSEEVTANHETNLSTGNEKIIDSDAVFSEETTLSLGLADYGRTVATAEHKTENSSHVDSSTAYVELRPPLQVEVSLSQPTQRSENLTTFTEITLQNFSAKIPSKSTIKSMLPPLKPNNTLRNIFSSLVPPPFVFQSKETMNSRKYTTEGKDHSVATNFTQNNVTEDEGKPRTSHRFTLAHNKNHVAHIPQQVTVNSATTPLAAADDPVTDDREARPVNTVPSAQSSDTFKSEQNSSTAPHIIFSCDDKCKAETKISPSFAKSSKINADTVDKLIYSNNEAEALPSSSDSTDSTLSFIVPIFPPMGAETPTSTARYDSHNFTAVYSLVDSSDDITLKNFRADNSSLDNAFRNIFQSSRENPTSELVFSINNLAVPITTAPSAFDIPSSEHSEVLPNTSPSSHIGYTLSAVTSQPSVSVDTTRTAGFVCTGRELHRYHPDTDDCRMFHYCSPGYHDRQVLDFRFICQNGTAFRADTYKCENEFLVPTCMNLKERRE
jgi:hypothetical protein